MDLDESLKGLVEELQLEEDLLIKFKLMIESYAQEKVDLAREELNEEIQSLHEELEFVKEKAEDYGVMLQEKADEYGKLVQEETLEEASEYADYVVEQFVAEHKDAFLKEEEYFRMKKTFDSLKESFQQNLFELEPSDSKLQEELDETKESYDALFENFSKTKKVLETLKKQTLFESKTKNLADTQKEKVSALIESINPKSLEEYGKTIDICVTELLTKQTKSINEEVETKTETKIDDKMSSYLKFL